MYKIIDGQFEMSPCIQNREYQLHNSITGQCVENIISAAIDAGLDWAILDESEHIWSFRPEGLPLAKYATQLLLEGRTIQFINAHDVIAYWELDLKRLLLGVTKWTIQEEAIPNFERIGRETADAIFQYALNGCLFDSGLI